MYVSSSVDLIGSYIGVSETQNKEKEEIRSSSSIKYIEKFW